jgi:hypothetical protein
MSEINNVLTPDQLDALAAKILSAQQMTGNFQITLEFRKGGTLTHINTTVYEAAPRGDMPQFMQNNPRYNGEGA